MATEQIGGLFPTTIPGYEDPADIQVALRLFLYGTDGEISDTNEIINASMARHLQDIIDSISALEDLGVGSEYSATEPTSPVDGYIWMDATTAAPLGDYSSFDPAVPGNWTTSPSTISEALNELAARVSALESL